MSERNTRRLTPWLLLAAFGLTLSTLALRDRLDAPQRMAVEPPPAVPVVVVAHG